MNRIQQLIDELCPNGVEFRELGEVTELVRGNGMPKSAFTSAGVGCIHYGQIYTYYGVCTSDIISFVSPAYAQSLTKVDTGDIIITNTSENLKDVCKAVAWLGTDQIVTGGHATVIKHNQDPKYLSYYFQTPEFSLQKQKFATGTKVIDVSAKSLARIRIPLPPIEIQREIVTILDTFTQLDAALKAELDIRIKQRAYYRDKLLSFEERNDIEFKRLGDVADIGSGKSARNEQDIKGLYPLYVRSAKVLKSSTYDFDDDSAILLPADGDIGEVLHFVSGKYSLHQRVYRIKVNSSKNSAKFIYHCMRSSNFKKAIKLKTTQGTVESIKKSSIIDLQIPIPPLEFQNEIAQALDTFDDLIYNIEREIETRQKQFEYYRNLLLTFKAAN